MNLIAMIIGMVNLLIGGVIVMIGWRMRPKNFYFIGAGILLVLGATIIGIIVGICGIINHFKEKKIALENNERLVKEQEIEREKAIERKNALLIYNKCCEKKISNFESKEDLDRLEIIASSFDIKDVQYAKKLYKMGKEITDEEIFAKEWQEIENDREEEYEEYSSNEQQAKIVGKIKYIKNLEDDIVSKKKMLEVSKSIEKLAFNNMNARAQESDWAIWGGMASGIAGPAAGLATAMDIQRKNAEAKENIEQVRESGRQLYNSTKDFQAGLPHIIEEEKRILNHIKQKLYDDKDIDKKMELIKFYPKYSILKSKNFKVTCNIMLKENISIMDDPAVLDGSLRINIKNENNITVATGIYSAPGFGETNFEKIGFNSIKNFNVICVTKNYEQIDENSKYICEINPINLWLIEK